MHKADMRVAAHLEGGPCDGEVMILDYLWPEILKVDPEGVGLDMSAEDPLDPFSRRAVYVPVSTGVSPGRDVLYKFRGIERR